MQLYPSELKKSFAQNECQLPGKVELIYPRPKSKLFSQWILSPEYFSNSSPKAAAEMRPF